MDGFCEGKSHLEMDDDWGYPYFRKPPVILLVLLAVQVASQVLHVLHVHPAPQLSCTSEMNCCKEIFEASTQ